MSRSRKGECAMKEAMLYEKLAEGAVRCAVCSHRCRIAPGKRGICAVRENRDGVLYALNYGKTIAAHIDPMEKKPLYHFLPGSRVYSFATVGCNFHCPWCQNWEISQSSKPDKEIAGMDISPAEHVARTLAYGCPAIAYTYSEPTIFLEYALDTMVLAREKGIKNVWHSNGYMSSETAEVILPYLDAANIDFKGPDDAVYVRYCGAKAGPVMENLKTFYQGGVHLEITTLVVPGVNDQPGQLEAIAHFIARDLGPEVAWHVSRFFPAWKWRDAPPTPLETMHLAESIGLRAGLRYVHLGNV